MSEQETNEITVKIANVFHNGKVNKFLKETDDVAKGLMAQEIYDDIGFDLIGHPQFDILKKAFDKVESQQNSMDDAKRNYEYLKRRGNLETDWSGQFMKSESILRDHQKNLTIILNSIAKTGLGKSV